MNILIVEDEATIREVEAAYLKQAGYMIFEAEDGEKALEIVQEKQIDLVVLDVNISKINGFDVCRKIREKSNMPIIMVTARIEEIDEMLGLNIGADDYVKKPFSPNVLVARVRTLLKRVGGNAINIDELTIDPEKMLIKKGENIINLTTTQFNILYTLAGHPGKVFTRDEILNKAYNEFLPPDILDRTVDAHIKSIRKVIEEDTRNPRYILTVIGRGYKFNDKL
jgi:DNA-binding response OmpR family regulator